MLSLSLGRPANFAHKTCIRRWVGPCLASSSKYSSVRTLSSFFTTQSRSRFTQIAKGNFDSIRETLSRPVGCSSNQFNHQFGSTRLCHKRCFSLSSHVLARHRTLNSIISSRSAFRESSNWRKNGDQKNGQDSITDNRSTSFVFDTKRNNSLSDRIPEIRTQFFDKNNNIIKEKIGLHRSRGAKAVRGLRRKLQAKVTQKEDIRTIPNLLTTLRMASAPALAYLVVHDYFGCALSIFVVAGFTDVLDGYIARNFKNQRTALGTALDPLADKLLVCCLTLSLTSAGLIPAPLTALILSRDAGLVFGSFIVRYKTLSPPRTLSRYFDVTHVTAKLFPSTISKINTGIQLSYVACVLASPVFGFVDHPLLQALMYTTAATTFLSGLDYVLTWRSRLKIVKNN